MKQSNSRLVEEALGQLSQAAALIDETLPKQTVCFEVISVEIALAAARRLAETNHCADDVLASLLWLLPQRKMKALAPEYLLPVICAMPALWRNLLDRLDGRQGAAKENSLQGAPRLARVIASTYLDVMLCRGLRQIYELPDQTNGEVSTKDFLDNFYSVACALAGTKKEGGEVQTKSVLNRILNPGPVGSFSKFEEAVQKIGEGSAAADGLVATTKQTIRLAGLTDALLPEESWVWQVEALPSLAPDKAQEKIKNLHRLLRYFWLTTGVFYEPKDSSELVFFVRTDKRSEKALTAIDRLMASISVRFSAFFRIEKVCCAKIKNKVRWSRASIYSWHMGLGYSGRFQSLIESRAADPLIEIIPLRSDLSQAEQLQEAMRMVRS